MPQRGYINLQLDFSSIQGRTYSVKLHSAAGEAKGQFHLPFSAEELQTTKHEIEKAILRQGKTRLAQPTEMDLIKDFGTRLFQAFSSNVIDRYHATLDIADQKPQCDGVRICLILGDPRLATLPWEFLFDAERGEFVGLSSRTPIVRYVELPRPARVLSIDLPLRITVVIASPAGTVPLNSAEEKRRIFSALGKLTAQGLVDLQLLDFKELKTPVTLSMLQRHLSIFKPHVLHFVGHGVFTKNDEGYLFFEDKARQAVRVGGTRLGQLLGDIAELRLVVLNACEAARSLETDAFTSVAMALVQRGLAAVVAMQFEVTDVAAIGFAEEFYDSIARGLPVDKAVQEGRKHIWVVLNNPIEWSSPVLFLRSTDATLFEFQSYPEIRGMTLTQKSPEQELQSSRVELTLSNRLHGKAPNETFVKMWSLIENPCGEWDYYALNEIQRVFFFANFPSGYFRPLTSTMTPQIIEGVRGTGKTSYLSRHDVEKTPSGNYIGVYISRRDLRAMPIPEASYDPSMRRAQDCFLEILLHKLTQKMWIFGYHPDQRRNTAKFGLALSRALREIHDELVARKEDEKEIYQTQIEDRFCDAVGSVARNTRRSIYFLLDDVSELAELQQEAVLTEIKILRELRKHMTFKLAGEFGKILWGGILKEVHDVEVSQVKWQSHRQKRYRRFIGEMFCRRVLYYSLDDSPWGISLNRTADGSYELTLKKINEIRSGYFDDASWQLLLEGSMSIPRYFLQLARNAFDLASSKPDIYTRQSDGRFIMNEKAVQQALIDKGRSLDERLRSYGQNSLKRYHPELGPEDVRNLFYGIRHRLASKDVRRGDKEVKSASLFLLNRGIDNVRLSDEAEAALKFLVDEGILHIYNPRATKTGGYSTPAYVLDRALCEFYKIQFSVSVKRQIHTRTLNEFIRHPKPEKKLPSLRQEVSAEQLELF